MIPNKEGSIWVSEVMGRKCGRKIRKDDVFLECVCVFSLSMCSLYVFDWTRCLGESLSLNGCFQMGFDFLLFSVIIC